MFSDTPAVDSGVKQAQVFVGRDTLVRRRRSNPSGHMDGLVVFACSSDASDGQSS